MDIKDKLTSYFPEILDAFFETENKINFLRIKVNLKKLDEITKLSKKISEWIDKDLSINHEYFLDIFSSGTEQKIDMNNLNEYINHNVFVSLINELKDKSFFEGNLIKNSKEIITIKWNAKGQFRNQEIQKSNIKYINLSAKIKKGKNERI